MVSEHVLLDCQGGCWLVTISKAPRTAPHRMFEYFRVFADDGSSTNSGRGGIPKGSEMGDQMFQARERESEEASDSKRESEAKRARQREVKIEVTRERPQAYTHR